MHNVSNNEARIDALLELLADYDKAADKFLCDIAHIGGIEHVRREFITAQKLIASVLEEKSRHR